jgi:selT/selW/selH-like putative selenoprotein
VSAASDLLSNYQHVIEKLTITTGTKGVFEVTVDGQMLFSKQESGRHAEPGEVLELFTNQFAESVPRYTKE